MTTLTRPRRTTSDNRAAAKAWRPARTTPDSPQVASDARDRAMAVRALGAEARAEAAAVVQAAREQLAAAERRAQILDTSAHNLDGIREGLDALAAGVDKTRATGQQADQAEAALAALEAEADALRTRAGELEARLAELASERHSVGAALDDALRTTDVKNLTALRPQQLALDEVTADLNTQLQAVRARLQQIGEPGAHLLLDQAAAEARILRRHHNEGTNAIGPSYVHLEARSALIHYLRCAAQTTSDAEKERHGNLLALLQEAPAFAGMLASARAHVASSVAR